MNTPTPRPAWMKFAATLLLILMASLAGCVALKQCPEMPRQPTRPEIYRLPVDDMFCMELDEAARLFEYLEALERGYR